MEKEIAEWVSGDSVIFEGRITEIRMLYTKKANLPMAVVVVELSGERIECFIFPEVYKKYGDIVEQDGFFAILGLFRNDEDESKKVFIKRLTKLSDR